jgi:hypothetical protein
VAGVCDGFDFYRSCYRNARRSNFDQIYQCDLYETPDCTLHGTDSDQPDVSDVGDEE